jgi:hypothetical protein
VVGVAGAVVLDQGELDFARFVGAADRPVAAANFGGVVVHDREEQAEGEYEKGKSLTESHKVPLDMSQRLKARLQEAFCGTSEGVP